MTGPAIAVAADVSREPRDRTGRWTSGTQHMAAGFEPGDEAPAKFQAAAEERLAALSFSKIGDVRPAAVAVLNAGHVAGDGTTDATLGLYSAALDRVYLAYDSLNRAKPDGVETGEHRWTVGTSALDQMVHEIGHHVYFKALGAGARADWGKLWGPAVMSTVSHYAGTTAAEGFAESFSAYASGAVLPPRVKQFMVDHVGERKK